MAKNHRTSLDRNISDSWCRSICVESTRKQAAGKRPESGYRGTHDAYIQFHDRPEDIMGFAPCWIFAVICGVERVQSEDGGYAATCHVC